MKVNWTSLQALAKAIKELLPKAHVRITWVVVLAGTTLLGTSLIESIINIIIQKTLNINLINPYDPLYGIVCIVLGLGYSFGVYSLETKKQLRLAEDQLKSRQKEEEHDKLVFESYEKVLSELSLKFLLDTVGSTNIIEWSQLERLDNYVLMSKHVQNSFIINDLKNEHESLIGSLNDYKNFVYEYFEPSSKVSRLYPRGNQDWTNVVDGDDYLKYSELLSELQEKSDYVRERYRKFRQIIQLTLSV